MMAVFAVRLISNQHMYPLFLVIHYVVIDNMVHNSTWTKTDSPYVLAIWTMSMIFIISKAFSIVIWKSVNSGLAVSSKIMVIDFVNLTLQEGIVRCKWTSYTIW